MAYDDELADRVRQLLADTNDVTEQKMFGGLAFLIGGHMSVAVSGEGGLLARVSYAASLPPKSKASLPPKHQTLT